MKKNLKNLTDEELVALVLNEDNDFYGEVVLRYQDKLLRYARTLLFDSDDAADVVQESLIKAFINLNGFNRNKKFSSWIYRIVHNLSIDFIRKNKRKVYISDEKWLDQVSGNFESLEDLAQKEFEKEKLTECLIQLPIKYRSVLTLFYFDEKSYEEISDILRMPKGTVATHLSRAKKAMAKVCKKKNGGIYD